MEKVKITQKMHDEMEYYRVGLGQYESKLDAFSDFMYDLQTERLDVVKGKSNDETTKNKYNMMHAYITGNFEIEPEYKKGDWIFHVPMSRTRVISSLTKDKYGTYAGFDNDLIQGVSAEYIRHATPQEIAKEKERRWWKQHGRKPWELKEGDLLMSLDDVHEVENPTSYGVWFKGFTSGLAYRVIKENYKVVCFKEDRKDA